MKYSIILFSVLCLAAQAQRSSIESLYVRVASCMREDTNEIFDVRVHVSDRKRFYEDRYRRMDGCMKDIKDAIDKGARADAMIHAIVELQAHGVEMYDKTRRVIGKKKR